MFEETLIATPPSEIVSPATDKLPSNRNIYWRTELNYGFTVTPFYKESQNIFGFEEISPLKHGVIRCMRCSSYISPYCITNKLQKSWVCAICYEINNFSPNYEFDFKEFPTSSYYDIYAPVEYIYKPLQKPCLIFLIDLSNPNLFNTQSIDLLSLINQRMHHLVNSEENYKERFNPKIGFVTFTSQSVHIYELQEGEVKITMCPEINESTPLLFENDIFFDMYDEESLSKIEKIIDRIKMMRERFTKLKSKSGSYVDLGNSCTEFALEMAASLLFSTGGKIVLFQGNIPATKRYDETSRKSLSITRYFTGPKDASNEIKVKTTISGAMKEMASKLLSYEISVDVHLLPIDDTLKSSPCTIDAFIELSKYGGHIYFYNFNKMYTPSQMKNEINQNVEKSFNQVMVSQAMMKIRMADVFQLKTLHGSINFNNQYISFPNLDETTTVSAEIMFVKNDESFSEKAKGMLERLERAKEVAGSVSVLENYFYFQVSILHTSNEPARKIRVINFAVSRSDSSATIYNSICPESYMGLIIKRAAAIYQVNGAQKARDYVNTSCKVFFKNYKRLNSIYTKNLSEEKTADIIKEMPIYTLGILKSEGFSREGEGNVDRELIINNIKSLSITDLMLCMRPELSNIQLKVPVPVLKKELLSSESIYVLKTYTDLLIRVGTNSSDMCTRMFGVGVKGLAGLSRDEIYNKTMKMSARENDSEIDELTDFIRERYDDGDVRSRHIFVVIEGTEEDAAFCKYLYGDRTANVMGIDDLNSYLNSVN
eukprot:GAHX01000684.1.p1 GENE.GAHX01000684.1~~GAHX01000684.1.p1  ORF type:complete len:769 (-),score=149.54 GAHX01000684.1:28-2334(-)